MPRRRTFATASCLRSLDADCAPASCLRLSATPALVAWAAPHGHRSGLPTPRRRPFATGILPFAHSMLTALRHPACAGQQRRLSGHGQPLTDVSECHTSPKRKRGLATLVSGFPCLRCGLGWRRTGCMPCFACRRRRSTTELPRLHAPEADVVAAARGLAFAAGAHDVAGAVFVGAEKGTAT
jgi:hypothetical protein